MIDRIPAVRRGGGLGRVLACAAFGVTALLCAPSRAAAAGSVPLTIRSLGAAQSNAPVFTGIPFPPGTLTNAASLDLVLNGASAPRQVKVLSEYPDGSVRVALLGFRVTVGAGGSFTATLRYGGAAGRTLSPAMAWSRNLNVLATCPPQWYGESTVFNQRFLPMEDNRVFPAFEDRLVRQFKGTSDPVSDSNPDFRNYYDHVHALYMTLLRGHQPTSILSRIASEVTQYREREILHSGSYKGQYRAGSHLRNTWPMGVETIRRLYCEGMLEDYYFSGDVRSWEVANEMGAAYLKDVPLQSIVYTSTERSAGFTLMGLTAMYEATLDDRYLTAAQRVAKLVMDHQAEMAQKYPNQGGIRGQTGGFIQDNHGRWADPEESTVSGAGSPFMSSLVCEGLIHLYWITGDTDVRDSVLACSDWLVAVGFASASHPRNSSNQDAFWYVAQDPDSDVVYPALNPMNLQMLGFAHQLTGDAKYLATARKVLAPNGWGRTVKEYNQALRCAQQGLYLLQHAPGTVSLTLSTEAGGGGNDTDTTPPAAPQGLAATPADRGADLAWTANRESDVAAYRVYRSADGVSAYTVASSSVPALSWTATGLSNGTPYWFRITAVDTAGNESAASAAVKVVPGVATFTVAGTVTAGGTGLQGVVVSGGGRSATTDAAGAYLLTDLVQGSFAINASKSGYSFGGTRTVTVGPSQTGIDFAAAANENIVIYSDALQNGWTATGSGSSYSLSNTSPVLTGSRSIGLTIAGADGRLVISGAGVSLAGKTKLKFSMHGGTTGGQQIRVRAIVDGRLETRSLNLQNYGGLPKAGGWIEYRVPLADLVTLDGQLTGLRFFAGQAEKRVYIDQIRLH